MRAFKIWNKNRTSSFDLSGLNVITTDVAGLGNKFTNELYDGRIKKHLINQYNSFEQISLTVNFGVHSNAYHKYREFMNFIQANGRNILVIEYYTPGASRFVDVVLSSSTKSQKTGFGVLAETVTFDRLTPYYILQRRTGRSVLVSNRYLENVVPRLELKNNIYPAGTKIRVKSKNEGVPDLSTATDLGGGNYRIYGKHGITLDYNINSGEYTLNGALTSSDIVILTIRAKGLVTLSKYYVSGTSTGPTYLQVLNPSWVANIDNNFSNNSDSVYTYNFLDDETLNTRFHVVVATGNTYNNYTFKLQLEKAGNNLELDIPREELKGYTLREVFQNRNKAIPNLSDAIDLGGGNYRIYNTDGITVDYNLSNGVYTVNGSVTAPSSLSLLYFDNLNILDNSTYTTYYVSGSIEGTSPFFRGWWRDFDNVSSFTNFSPATSNISRVKTDNVKNFTLYIQSLETYTFNNYQFKFQIEKGSTATPYQVPTNGPYSDVDLGQFGLTNEQVNYYGALYNTLLTTPTEYAKPITSTQEIELAESVLVNQTLVIDSENKTVTLDGANAYQVTNKDKSTFLNLPEGDYLIECDTPITVEYKRWVID